MPDHAGSRRYILAGQSQHAKPVCAQLLVLLLEVLDEGVLHRELLAVQLESAAAGKDCFRGAFADQAVVAFRCADHHCHDPSLEVEGDLVDLRIFGYAGQVVRVGMGQDRPVSTFLKPFWK